MTKRDDCDHEVVFCTVCQDAYCKKCESDHRH